MATKVKNLKVLLSGDTKPYREEVDKAVVATNKLKGDAAKSLNDLALVFGIQLSVIQARLTAFQTVFTGLLTGMKASSAGAGIFAGAMNIIKIAMASTGIGLLVVALSSLVAYFTKTREGAAFVKVVLAEIKAIINVLIDRFSSFGEGLFKIFSGDFQDGWNVLKGTIRGVGTEMVEEAKAAGQLQKETNALNKAERELIYSIADRKARAAELRAEAKEEEYTAQQKKAMLNEAKALLISAFDDEQKIAKGRADIAEKQSALHKNMGAELTALEEAKAKVRELDREEAMTLKMMSREYNAVNKQIKAQEEATLKLIEAKRKEDAKGVKTIYANNPKLEVTKDGQIVDPNALAGLDELALRGVKAQTAMENLKGSMMDLTGVVSSGMESMAFGFGEFFGSLMKGEGSMQNFGKMVASVFADMAISVGKIAIQTGIAALGINIALKSLNPAVAIAAGVALVALGTAVKSSLGSVATSGGSASVSGIGSGGNYNFDTRQSTTQTQQPVRVVVSGEFKLRNNTLVAAVSQEEARKSIS